MKLIIYHLVLEDAASDAKPSGESITEKELEPGVQLIVAAMPISPTNPMSGAKIRFTTIMAGMNILHTLSQLNNPPNDDSFDTNLMMDNAKILPPRHLGLLGLSVVNSLHLFGNLAPAQHIICVARRLPYSKIATL
jgi:hypothetical protein